MNSLIVEADTLDDLHRLVSTNGVEEFDDIDSAYCLKKFNKIFSGFKACHTRLKVALGDQYPAEYGHRLGDFNTFWDYERDLRARGVSRRKHESIFRVEEKLHDERVKVRKLRAVIGLAYEKIASPTQTTLPYLTHQNMTWKMHSRK